MTILGLVLGCAPSLIRTGNVWKYDEATYELSALPDGRIMPDGWALKSYRQKSEAHLEHVSGNLAHLSFVRNDDDGRLQLGPVELSDLKKLPVYVDRYVDQMRKHEEEVTVRNLFGIPQGTSTVKVDHPVHLVASGSFGREKVEAYEAVYEQRRPGEEQAYRVVYIAFARPVNGSEGVVVVYENSVGAFKDGLEDVRKFVRRVRFGDRTFDGSMDPFRDGGAPAEPLSGGAVEI